MEEINISIECVDFIGRQIKKNNVEGNWLGFSFLEDLIEFVEYCTQNKKNEKHGQERLF